MTLQTSVASAEPYIPGRARSEVVRKVLLYGLYLAIAAVFFVPFLWTLTTSFKTIPDSVNVTFFAAPVDDLRLADALEGLRLPDLHQEQPLPLRSSSCSATSSSRRSAATRSRDSGSPAASSCSCSCSGR